MIDNDFKVGAEAKANQAALKTLTDSIAKTSGAPDLEQFKAELDILISQGFDPKYVDATTEDQYNSLLKACLSNPTDENFKIFQYLIENNIVSIEDQLSAKTISWDCQNPPPSEFDKFTIYSAKVTKFLDYIDGNTTDEQKNKCQLFNLSIYFNHVPLFEKLLSNEAIAINSPGQRDTLPITDIFMSDFRVGIREKFIKSEKFVENKTGALRDNVMMQLLQFAPLEVLELALQPSKLPKYSNFSKAIHVSLSQSVADPKRNKAFLKIYNTIRVDTLEVMATKGNPILLASTPPEWEKSAYNMLLFLNKPSAIDLIIHSDAEVRGETVADLGLPKLVYILECVRDLEGLNFSHIANEEHVKLLDGILGLSDKDINRLVISLNIEGERRIKDFCEHLKGLSGSDLGALFAVNKLEEVMQAMQVEREMNPVLRFFVTLFTDPMKLFSPPLPITAVNPISVLSANDKQGEVIEKVMEKSQQMYKARGKVVEVAKQPKVEPEPWKFPEAEKAQEILQKTRKHTDKLKASEDQKKNWKERVSETSEVEASKER